MDTKKKQEELSLEDILKSVRNMIDGNYSEPPISKKGMEESDYVAVDDYTAVLELKNPVISNKDKDLISEKVRKASAEYIKDFTQRVEGEGYDKSSRVSSIEEITENLMLPLLREWLNNNLPRIVEQVVTREIRKLIPDKDTKK